MSIIANQLFHQIFGAGDAPAVTEPCYTSPADRAVLLALCRAFRPRTVIEIGVQRGATAKLLLDNCPWITEYIGIDVPPGTVMPLPGQQSEVPAAAGELVKADPRVKIIIRANGSLDLEPEDLPLADLVFIDGDHSSAAVAADTALARAILRPGGVCVWHDYNNRTVGVSPVIDQINTAEGNHICLVDGSWVCFEIRQTGGVISDLLPSRLPPAASVPDIILSPSLPGPTPTPATGAPSQVPAAAPASGSQAPRRKGSGKPASAGVPASGGAA